MSTKKTRQTRSRKRRFEDSDDSDSTSLRTSPKKKRRRTLQLSQSDEESNKKPKKKSTTKRKSKKTPKVNRTPKPLKLVEAKPDSINERIIHYNNLSSPSPCESLSQSSNNNNTNNTNNKNNKPITSMKKNTPKKNGSLKKKKKEPKSHDIRNFFCSANDYFSKFNNKPNYKNLKKQTKLANSNHNNNNNNNNNDDTEMKSTSDSEQKININMHKPLKKRKKIASPIINNKFAELSCNTKSKTMNTNTNNKNETESQNNIPISNGISKPKKQSTTRKRKLDEISQNDNKNKNNKQEIDINPTPAKKPKKFYPGFKRSDMPPQHGEIDIPIGKSYCLSNMRFVITGQLPSLTRDECSDIIKQYGGRVTGAVSGMTRYLIAGSEAGAGKTKKAKEKKVKIITENDLFNLLRTLPKGKAPTIKLPKQPSKSKNKNKTNNISNKKNKNNNNILFVDKYKPQTSSDLIGNNKCIKQLKDFLLNWDTIKNKSIRGKNGVKKGVLLSGQPGIGKTSAINVIANELLFDTIEFNASDTRSKKSLKNAVEQSLNNNRISDFFAPKNKNKNKNKNIQIKKKHRNLIIMDEVDGMSSGDRGGIQELINYIDKSKIPIICICNDRNAKKIRTLTQYCLDLRFRKPTVYQIQHRLYTIAINEGFKCDLPTIQKLADGTNGDIRQMLHLLQFWSNDNKHNNNKNNNLLQFKDVSNKLKNINQKDLTMGPWDVVPKLFRANEINILQGIEYYFVDYSLIPLMVYENYLNISKYNNNKYNTNQLWHLSRAAETIADGDLIDNNIRKSQQYYALPYHGVLSSIKPGKYIAYGNCGKISQRIAFPQWLGKYSGRKKNERGVAELAINMNTTNNVISLDVLNILKEKIINPLKGNNGSNNIDNVIQFMKMYNINRNDWDIIYNLGQFNNKNKKGEIITKVKTAFTRRCNSQLNVKNVIKNKKGRIGDLKVKNMADVVSEDDDIQSESDNNNDDISKDNLIKMKKGKNKKKNKNKNKKVKETKNKKKRRTKKTLDDD